MIRIAAVYPDISFQQAYPYSGVPADLTLLKQLSADDAITVALELDFDHNPNDGIQTHFVEMQSYDGHTMLIADPWYSDASGQYGEVADFTRHYGGDPAYTILKFIVYRGKPTQISVTTVPFTAAPARAPLGFFQDAGLARRLYESQATQAPPNSLPLFRA